MIQAIEDSIRRSNNTDGTQPGQYLAQLGANRSMQHSRQQSEPQRPASQPQNPRDELHLNMPQSKFDVPDPLLLRFSQLRVNDKKPPYPIGIVGLPSSPSPGSRDGNIPLTQTSSAPAIRDIRPAGPRDLPSVPTNPPIPPKVPIARINTSLPRAPSPIYSPARNIAAPSTITPPRSTARSIAIQNAIDSPPSYPQHLLNGYTKPNKEPIKSNPELPETTIITAQELYDRLRVYNILVIDVRPRAHFDEGHIYGKSVMCIEPMRLQYGMSFEELQETLIYCSDTEIQMFERLSDYDLVVYHDQDTQSDSFLDGSPKNTSAPWLRALYEMLVTFNDRLPLCRLPVVLSGGLDAWIDLVGLQSLHTSETLQIPNSTLTPKPPRRLPHRPSISHGTSSREIRMRRLQHYDPLNADEKRKWQEMIKEEEVKPADLREYQADGQEIEESPTYHRSIDDFIRRYPEASQVPVSMVRPVQDTRVRQMPVHSIPSIPSRPAPAVSRPSYGGVSDRDLSAVSPTSRQAIQGKTPLYTPRLISSLKLPRTGLVNFGVTCYMNSTVQCLSGTIDLSTFFLEETWRNYVQSKNWKGSEGILPDIFSNLIRSLWKNDSAALRPKSLRTFCTRLNSQWSQDRQQDAQEFLMFLLDCLHEDLNTHWNRTALRPLTSEEELNRERMPINKVSQIEWGRYSHRESSYISNLFAGQHASRLTCLTCRNTSTSYEAFYSLSLEIPQTGSARITDCLKNYCKEEMLEPGEEWKCPVCKCRREATKTIRITRLPKILVVYFKRFSGSLSGSTRKIHTAIDFPLFNLDLQPYMFDTRLPPEGDYPPDPAITPPFLYDAYAVTRHIGGSLEGGHYIAMVRDAAKNVWRRFDDDRVSDFEPSRLKFDDRLQNEQAYIVFYERARAR
jgi:ubiquitin carboxyl-terminal hydrolase 8